ncbi:MAG: peptide chain release factor N(5)-glutamine methyltransferase [Clostridia bacterium]|nr:peptide chain release factor N(5)-glutamine methyltransferase [Clostridia bacterium]
MKKKTNRTYIGGQAVIQGVMMRGKRGMATVVRDDNGELQTEAKRITPPEQRSVATRIPFVRGAINFFSSLVDGMRALLRSSEAVIVEEETPSKLSKWMEEKWKVSVSDILTWFALAIGIALALVLFIWLPGYLTDLIASIKVVGEAIGGKGDIWYSLIEGGFRLIIFIGYILLTLLLPSMRVTYQYHGAEHKTINCYEYGMPLTVENVKKCSRLHDRCGTTFLFIVMIISILLFALANWVLFGVLGFSTGVGVLDRLVSMAIKLVLIPVVAGISYEILKFFALFQSPLVLPFKAPGYLLQKLTTKEPTDEMIECAIGAFEKTLEMDADPESPEKTFATTTKLTKMSAMMKKHFAERDIDESDAEWILSLTLKIPRSALKTERIISRAECKKILEIYEQRLTGRPLWYIYGNTEFYGYTFKVDERVLIPRPETEILVRQAVSALKDGESMLDLCTGSGAIAVTVAAEVAKDRSVTVTGTDISAGALQVARENARINKANVTFIKSDLFESVRGRFNLITANPPYVRSGEIAQLSKDVRDFEPKLALDGGVDGLDFYRRIAEKINRYVARGGMCILEVGEGQAQDVIRIFREKSRCDFAMVVKDLAGVERVVKIGF